jgi:hypothetical protein
MRPCQGGVTLLGVGEVRTLLGVGEAITIVDIDNNVI